MEQVSCPICQQKIIKREGKYGIFYGCSGYPSCRFIMPQKDYYAATRLLQAKEPERTFTPSKYQSAIFDWVQNGTGNLYIEAVAGSGKSTTLVQAMKLLPVDKKVVFCAFNKHIADALRTRVPEHIKVATLHSLGLATLIEHLPAKPTIEDGKIWDIMHEVFINLPDNIYNDLRKIVSLCKATLIDYTNEQQLVDMLEYYNFEFDNNEIELICNCIPKIMQLSLERVEVIDFDDMIWLPIILHMQPAQYDWILVDESQDLNAAQIQFLLTLAHENTRVMAVGDKAQSIEGFRAADGQAIEKLAMHFNMQKLPLSICYRCPTSHISLAQNIVPQIEARHDAPEGIVETVTLSTFYRNVQDGDLVLCRVNRFLVDIAYTLLRRGSKVIIRGRDIGSGLISLIDRMRAKSIQQLEDKLQHYYSKESVKLIAANKLIRVAALKDKIDTIVALCDGIYSITELKANIRKIFDDDTKTGIILSTVHRAKGDEANRIWIIQPHLMPHPMAKNPNEIAQENNLIYFSRTRSKSELYFVE